MTARRCAGNLCGEISREDIRLQDRVNEHWELWTESFAERANEVIDALVREKVDDYMEKHLTERANALIDDLVREKMDACMEKHVQEQEERADALNHRPPPELTDGLMNVCLEALSALIDDKLDTSLDRLDARLHKSAISADSTVVGISDLTKVVPMSVAHSLGSSDAECEQEYRLSASVWDATLLIFVGAVSLWDSFLIAGGFVLNLFLQSVMIWTLIQNMHEHDYGPDSIRTKLEWRVETGHSLHFAHAGTGESMIDMLCRRSLWSFEQEEYNKVWAYQSQAVPGIFLTLMALILWVMSCSSEFRLIFEKMNALIALPVVQPGAPTLRCVTNSQFQVAGFRKCHRILAIVIMVVPRLAFLVVLCWAGCKYLAQIVTLSDIVLNACGLAFVLDIDEMSAAVFLPCSVLVTLARTRSMKYGKPYTLGEHIVLKHVVRLLLFVCITVTVFLVYAVPFKECIKASEEALCAGVRNFTFEGGTPSNIPVIIKEASVTEPCHGKIAQDYFEQNFPGNRTSDAWDNATPLSTEVKTDAEFIAQRLSAVLSVVYRDCGKWGYTDEYSCKPVTVMVQEALIKLNMTPERQPLANCPRIAISRITNCDFEPPGMPEICRYSVLAQECEGASPGVAMMLCNADLWRSCEAWKRIGLAHPTRNCLIAETCPPGHNCIAAIGNVILRVSNLDLDAASFDQNFKENLRELLVPGFQEAFYELCELLDHTTEELSKELPEVNFRPDDMRLLAGSTNQTVIKLTYYVYPVPDVVVEGFLQRVKFQEAVMNHTTAALETSDGVKVMELTISEPVFQKG